MVGSGVHNRFAHMLLAFFLSAVFPIAGVAGWYLLKGYHESVARVCFSLTLGLAAVLAPAQILIGDLHGLQVQRDQSVKVAAMEGLWKTGRGVPFLIFAWPDQEAETNHFEIGIPKAASLILKHHPEGEVKGLVSLMTGLALMCGYSLLGATWLIIKTTGALQQWAYQAARWLLLIVLAWIGMVSLWTPLAKPEVAERWFS